MVLCYVMDNCALFQALKKNLKYGTELDLFIIIIICQYQNVGLIKQIWKRSSVSNSSPLLLLR